MAEAERSPAFGAKVRRSDFAPAAIALAGSAFLIYWTSTARPLWVDEELLLLNVRDRGFLQLAGSLWLDQSAPLGWLFLERLVLLTFGTSEPAVRLLTVLFGISTLVTAVWIGRRWMTIPGSAVCVALVALGEWPVFFTLELKHYSADMFGALLVPALAGWVLDALLRPADLRRRLARWWIVTAIAEWFSNGALFVTPLTAVVLAAFSARTRDIRVARSMIFGALLWSASSAANYLLVLRHASGNAYLQNYWAFAFPPLSNGVGPTLGWIVGQFEPFARKPGSSGLPVLFWLAWAAGVAFAIARRRRHGIVIATVPLAALALALFHLVPPFERLALWVVPSMYAGLGYSADAALAIMSTPTARYRGIRIAVAAVAISLVIAVSGDIVWRGISALTHRPRSNYGLDDRSSIRWLLSNHRAGDPILTTHFGLAALWWYGNIPTSSPERGSTLPDGSAVYEIGHVAPDDCRDWQQRMDAELADHERAVVYLGFRMNVEPVGFDNLALNELEGRGALEAYREYAEESRLAVFNLGRTSEHVVTPGQGQRFPVTAQGCVAVRRAARW